MLNETTRIMVVDDEPDVEILFKQHFRKEIKAGKLDLIFAFSAKQALDYLENDIPPSVIYMFSDINMPEISGMELLKQIQQSYPSIKVSMISAYSDTDSIKNALADGAEHFFCKPIDFSDLKQRISDFLHSK